VQNRVAFTIVEILIVVIIMSVIAGFAIPNYNKAQDRSNEREAVINLRLVGIAMQSFKLHDANDEYPSADLPQVSDINTALSLGIIEQTMDYDCVSSTSEFDCTAVHPNGWEVSIETNSGIVGVVHCSNNTCPQCSGTDCPSY